VRLAPGIGIALVTGDRSSLVDLAVALVGLAILSILFVRNVIYARLMVPRISRASAVAVRVQTSTVAYESSGGALVARTMGPETVETPPFGTRAAQPREPMIWPLPRRRGLYRFLRLR
jgi:ATP-binding cassette subfamily B protein